MGAVTYPNQAVAEVMNADFIPVQLNVQENSERVNQYQAIWTPNINVVDGRERVLFHLEGWLSPMEFTAMLHCGRGHYALHQKDYDQAVDSFQRVVDNYPQSEFAPRSLYYAAVGQYMRSQDAGHLMDGWQRLRQLYPASAWAFRTRV